MDEWLVEHEGLRRVDAPVLGNRECLCIDLGRQRRLTAKHRVAIPEHCANVLSGPRSHELRSRCIKLLGLENDTDVLQDGQRYEALLGSEAAPVAHNVLDGASPARVCCVESDDGHAHAQTTKDELVVRGLAGLAFPWRPHQLE